MHYLFNFIKSLFTNNTKSLMSISSKERQRILLERNTRKTYPKPNIPNKTTPIQDGNVLMYLNDPSRMDLVETLTLFKQLPLNFTVNGFQGGGFALGSVQSQSSQVHNILCVSLQYVNQMLNKPLSKWSGTGTLLVNPRAGNELNAYYNRHGLFFFSEFDQGLNKKIYTCESMEIVAHELGHAILDSIRPDFWNVPSLEVIAFHEGFSDCIAVLTTMQFDKILNSMLVETNNTLRGSNVATKLAEEMGGAIYKRANDSSRMNDAIRNVYNDFKYTAPESLPKNAPFKQLSANHHSFGRLWSGTWYEILIGIYESELALGHMDALKKARDVSAKLLLNALPLMSVSPKLYEVAGTAMLSVDRVLFGGQYSNIIRSVLESRNILPVMVKTLSVEESDQLKSHLKNKKHRELEIKDGSIICRKNLGLIKLEDHVGVQTLSNNFSHINLEVASEDYYEFQENNLIEYIILTKKEIIDSAFSCMNMLSENGDIAEEFDVNKAFFISNNKLVRNNISCCCHQRRSDL